MRVFLCSLAKGARGQSWRLLLVALVAAGLVSQTAAPSTALDGGTVVEASVPPARPTGLRVVSEAHGAIALAWDDPGDNTITGYQILRRLRDSYAVGRFDIIDNTQTPATAYTDTEVTPNTRYVYRVKAINTAVLSPKSTFLRAQPPPTKRQRQR